MNRKAVFLVMAVFVLGLVLGGLSTHLVSVYGGFESGSRGHREPAKVVEELTHELNLNPDQQKQLTTTLEETRAKFQAIYDQYRPQREHVRQEARQKIRAFLTPEQLPKFEAWLQKIDEARKKRNGR